MPKKIVWAMVLCLLVGGAAWVQDPAVDARADPDFAKVRLAGPFVGLSLRF